ncbi:MAG: hypothetical protein GF317_18885 [Candidatus Lokiarchaeota archaeon]|nr:hypothetical protein [Candidatus Lokiarchaeota archaeon]MBD3201584.1 hypothetical protein [Candidatus Lokiarchaeota archaeon]
MSTAKGIGWFMIFLIDGLIFSIIPSYLIVVYWQWLNSLTIGGDPIYTLVLFILFLWVVSLLISLIYYVASVRAVVQRKNDDLGISKGVKLFGTVSAALVIIFMIFWYFFTGGAIAFFSWKPV